MKFKLGAAAMAAVCALSPASLAQQEPLHLDAVNQIWDQGFRHSEVMNTLSYMTDVIGPRLTASPGMRRAQDWAEEEFRKWGLENIHREGFEFGPGWSYSKVLVRMTAPRLSQLHAMPISWHPGTDGTLTGEVIAIDISKEEDFENYSGKLQGKIVLLGNYNNSHDATEPVLVRHDDDSLAARRNYRIPKFDPRPYKQFEEIFDLQAKLFRFLEQEGALAVVKASSRDSALLDPAGYLFADDLRSDLPAVLIAREDYNLIKRLIDRGSVIDLEVTVDAEFHPGDGMGYSVYADLPGRGRNPEIVMAGAHFDSWFAGDGAVDNGAGSAVMMEAARILAALDFNPKRTIRFALWGGEEQGLFGSEQYVTEHLADRPMVEDEEAASLPRFFTFQSTWPVQTKDEYDRFSAYFNLDNGSGKIRGIYGQGNVALKPIFERWFEPFHDVGAKTVVLNRTGGTDHLFYQWVGLPAFQFIQDPLDYGSRLHHTQLDVLDFVKEDDLKQASVIIASFLYHAAMRDELLPRKPIPSEPPENTMVASKPEEDDGAADANEAEPNGE